MKKTINEDVTIAVTGGSTMDAVANAMVPFKGIKCLFVPARGGLGKKLKTKQIRSLQKWLKLNMVIIVYSTFQIHLSETLYQSLIHEPSIAETLSYIKKASIVLHGISDAFVIAKRRKTSQHVLDKLKRHHAVSEAFGYYFNENGEIVHKLRTIGIHLEDLDKIETVITVAGGTSKARAIASFLKQKKSHVLITDEAAAKEIVQKYL